METLTHDGRILAIVYRNEDWKEGLQFMTPDELFVQVGTWFYPKGKVLDTHVHKEHSRTATKTHEMTYMRKGSMKVFLFDDRKNKVNEFVLREGDTAVFAGGGHGYEILEDGTQVLEAKNGPFVSVEKDKEKF